MIDALNKKQNIEVVYFCETCLEGQHRFHDRGDEFLAVFILSQSSIPGVSPQQDT